MATSAAGAGQLAKALSNLGSASGEALRAARDAERTCRQLSAAASAGHRSASAAAKVYREGDVVSRVDSVRDQAEESVDFRVRVYGWALTEHLEDFLGQASESARLARAVHEMVADLKRECDDARSQMQSACLHLDVVARALNDLYGATIDAEELMESWPRAEVAEVRAGAMTVKRLLQSGRTQFDLYAQARTEGYRRDLFDERWDHQAARDQYARVVHTCEQIPGLMDQADAACDAFLDALREIAEG